ncbi:hypothetical protein DVH05_009155 [Phytophthora capsici]|nr:hypothetical protein DVH05_009155 [Phytophthora capsici]
MLGFVLAQWRNVRQKKMLSIGGKVSADKPARAKKEYEPGRDYDSLVKKEINISSSEEDDEEDRSSVNAESDNENDSESKNKARVEIRLNPKARKVGRPQNLKKKTAAGEKKDRKWYEATEAARAQAGEVTLLALFESLDREQPGLMETQRRLSGIIVKHGDAEKKKPKLKLMKNPVLTMDPFYLLPTKLLDACVKLLPVSNTEATAISVDNSQSSQPPSESTNKAPVETLIIKDVGNFSRKHIETFKRVQILKEFVAQGMDVHKWLVDVAGPALPAEYHSLAQQVADEVMAAYPYKRIEGLPDVPDFAYTMLYRAAPPSWLTDATITGLCMRLVKDYPMCRFAGFQAALTKSKRTRNPAERCLDEATRDRVVQQVSEDGVDTVMLPLNFSNYHWCCVVVKVERKRIFYYDPLNQAQYMNAANAVATSLKLSGLTDYDVIPMNNPIQFDGHSCGVYVCWMFIGQVLTEQHLKVSLESLTKRRFELFYYLLTGKLLPAQGPKGDETEEKMPAPRADDEETHDEETPPTQVQQ